MAFRDEFLYAEKIAAHIDRQINSILQRSNTGNIEINWDHVSFLMGLFEQILYTVMETDRATVSRVRDSVAELLKYAGEAQREAIFRMRDRYSADLYRELLPLMPFSEDTREQIQNGRSSKPMVALSCAAASHLCRQGYSADTGNILRRTMEFLRDPAEGMQ